MSRTIDSRVVEMRFDNKQFEAGAKKTMNTLSKLKEALKLPDTGKALEGIDKATKNISLDGIAAGVDALNKKFSTLGIVGMRVISNVTDGLMNKLNKAVNFVTDSIISGGVKRAMNIENAHFQLQALLKDETKVQAVMADAMESVDGTAYAYDEAAKAASQFSASGVQAGEDMLNALKGITGVAAMTNSDFESISSIFTTVAGNGRLMGDQLLQLSSRGLNAASTLADYFKEVRGQSGATEAEIRELVSKGKISFKDFSDAMTWAFGDSAKRANETFTGAMSNMKSALARIGAGFISPLVEQNSELVNLFNTLRIQINNVKTALVFDEQSSAISGITKKTTLMVETVSQFAKEGKIGFDTLTTAILGTSKSEKELEKANEKLTELFDQVKESSSVSVDMLKEFNSNGISAASSIQTFLNGIMDGSIKASKTVKDSISEITNGAKVGAWDVMRLAEEGKISYEILTSAIVNSSGVIKENADVINETVSGLFAKVKESGSVSVDMLEELTSNGLAAGKVIRDYMNSVLNGTTRASYATRQAIEEITEGATIGSWELMRLAEEGKITYDIFQSAMETFYGDQNTKLTKQFTDFVLDSVKKIVKVVETADLTKPMEALYYGIESVKNVSKGLFSILKPIGISFADVFNFSGDDLVDFAAMIEKITYKMQLSEDQSKNLHDAFEGIFSVIKLGVDVFFALLGAILPINRPILEASDGFLGLAGAIGRGLKSFTEVLRSSTLIRMSFKGLSSIFSITMTGITKMIKVVKKFGSSLSDLEGSVKFVNAINSAFKKISNKATPYIKDFISDTEEMFESLFNLKDIDLDSILKIISDTLSDIAFEIDNFSFDGIKEAIDKLRARLQALADLAMSNEGIRAFVVNLNEYMKELQEAFTMDNLLDRVEKVMSIFGNFFNWVKTVMSPAFEDFSVGGAVATGGGIGIIYALIKAAKSLEKISTTLESIPNILGAVKGTLVAYQKDLKADAMLKIAAAITVLAVALVLLSFADSDRLMGAAVALTMVAGILMLGISKFLDAVNKGRELNDALQIFAKRFGSAAKKLGRAMEIKALGSAVKDFAESIAIIVGSIVVIGIMYNRDPEAFNVAIKTIGGIAAVMVVIGTLLVVGSKFANIKGITAISKSMLFISASLFLIVSAITKLMKMELPDDYGIKLTILGGIFVSLALLMAAIGYAGNLSGGNEIKNISSTIKSMAVLLLLTVVSLNMLFKMELPKDYGVKLGILGGIFVAMAGLMIAMAGAAKLAGGQGFKAGTTILAMAAFLVVVVGALFVLTLIPADKMAQGAAALGTILITLGIALAGAGKVTKKDTYKTVIAMAITVGTITAALAVLSMVPWKGLLKSTLALGSVLLALALDFYTLGKVKGIKKTLPAVLGMIAAMTTIAFTLYVLAEQPWQGLLAAAGSLSTTILAFALSFDMILSKNWSKNNVKKIGTFLLLITSIIPIATVLGLLANEPWQGLLSAAGALSATILAFSLSFEKILSKNWSGNNVKKIGTFLLLILAIIPIAAALKVLANEPWQGLLVAAGSLSAVLLAFTVAMAILTKIGTNIASAAQAALALDAFIVIVGALMLGLGALFSEFSSLEGYLDKGIEILIKIGDGLGRFVGAIINGVAQEIFAGLPMIGDALSGFWSGAKPFFDGFGSVPDSVFDNMISLAGALIALTASELINGMASLLGADSLSEIGAELSLFMASATPFFMGLGMIKPETIEAAKMIADMILALTGAQLIRGLGEFFGLTGSLSDFGEELKAFGPSIVEFADTVKDVNPAAVEGAASAAKIMSEVAENLPAQNGLAQKIFGAHSLKEFGEELRDFGPSIKQFAERVKDVNPAAVEGAASAAKIMSEVAENLPAQNGLAQKIFGAHSLKEFGEELRDFGPSIRSFAKNAKEVDPGGVTGVSLITQIMARMADLVPESGGFAQWFKGEKSLSAFGEDLKSFGDMIKNFYESVKDIEAAKITMLGNALPKILDFVTGMSTVDTSGFVSSFGELAKAGLGEFIDTFTRSKDDVVKTAVVISETFIITMRTKLPDKTFEDISFGIITAFISGLNAKSRDITSAVNEICNTVVIIFNTKISNIVFEKIGSDAMKGLANGISSELKTVKDASEAVSGVIIDTSKKVLDEHSPSKELFAVGKNADLGLANGLIVYAHVVKKASEGVSKGSINPFVKAMNDLPKEFEFVINTDPVISPIVDLSNITKSAKSIQSMFNSAITLNIDAATSVSSTFQNKRTEDKLLDAINHLRIPDRDSNNSGNTYVINGINYQEGDEVSNAIESLIRAAKIKRRV